LDKPTPPTPRPIGLASWLGGGSVIIVLLAVVGMALACALLLHRLVQQQALVRAQLAVSSARELLRRADEDALADARALAQQPTLQRLLTDGDDAAVPPVLQRYCASSRNDVCAVRRGERLLLAGGSDAPWAEVNTAIDEQGERFWLAPKSGSVPLWGATAQVAGAADARVIVLRLATAAVLDDMSKQVGAELTLISYAGYHAPPDDALTPLHSIALSSGQPSATRLAVQNLYAASTTVATGSGEIVALLDARLSGGEFAATAWRFDRLLILIACLVAAVAGVAGLLYGRWLAQPVIALRDVALRIGRGDLSAAVPPVAPLEVGALARSMDEMRRNLVELTESLRRREAEAQALLHGIVEGVYAVDADRRIRYVNPQAARLFGRSEAEILGRFCGDVLNPQTPDGVRPCEQHCPIVAARTSPQGTAQETLGRADGTTRAAIIVSAPPVAGVQVQVIRDETDLEAARRARDSVLGNISHEFRTPLAAQLASIELLRDGLSTLAPAQQGELLANVERGVLRLMRLIDNLLESVRIESGQLAIRHQWIDLQEIVREAGDLLAPLLVQRSLTLQVALQALPDAIPGDAERLTQVLINLLSNSIKFAPDGTVIAVGGQTLERDIELWVEDQGPGVAESNQTAIFERFRRAEGTEPDAPGLGLGLWIVKSIVARHAGSVRVERTTEQRTRFTVTLPRGSQT
jgi:signal transduction histidine kinase/HAMP domain-containing protein